MVVIDAARFGESQMSTFGNRVLTTLPPCSCASLSPSVETDGPESINHGSTTVPGGTLYMKRIASRNTALIVNGTLSEAMMSLPGLCDLRAEDVPSP